MAKRKKDEIEAAERDEVSLVVAYPREQVLQAFKSFYGKDAENDGELFAFLRRWCLAPHVPDDAVRAE